MLPSVAYSSGESPACALSCIWICLAPVSGLLFWRRSLLCKVFSPQEGIVMQGTCCSPQDPPPSWRHQPQRQKPESHNLTLSKHPGSIWMEGLSKWPQNNNNNNKKNAQKPLAGLCCICFSPPLPSVGRRKETISVPQPPSASPFSPGRVHMSPSPLHWLSAPLELKSE